MFGTTKGCPECTCTKDLNKQDDEWHGLPLVEHTKHQNDKKNEKKSDIIYHKSHETISVRRFFILFFSRILLDGIVRYERKPLKIELKIEKTSSIIACKNRCLSVCFSTSLLYFTILQIKTSGKGITRVVVLFWQIPRTMNDLSGVKETRPWSQKITRVIDTSFHVHYIRLCADTVETDMHHASLVTHKRSTETFTAPLFTRRALPRPTKSVKHPPLTRPNGVYKNANEINRRNHFSSKYKPTCRSIIRYKMNGRRKI